MNTRILLGAALAATLTAHAALPPQTDWILTASEPPEEQYAPAFACDGKRDTRWSSPASDPQWLQVDLGREAALCGATILWETAYASAYTIQLSRDGERWEDVYTTDRGDGLTDDLFFAPATARYVRVLGRKRGTQWGHSIWELTLKDAEARPRLHAASAEAGEPGAAFDGRLDTMWTVPADGPVRLDLDLRAAHPSGGVRVDWGDAFASNLVVFASDDGSTWRELGRQREGSGRFDLLLHPATAYRYVRLEATELARPGALEFAEISFRGPDEPLSPSGLYRLAAQKAPRGAYPMQFLDHQVYWTLLAIPGDRRECLFDEYGNLEPWQGASVLMPYLWKDDRLWSALDFEVSQQLDEQWLPLPSVRWRGPDVTMDIEAMAAGDVKNSTAYLRYRIANTGTARWSGRLYLATRPVQLNPAWQHGGLSPIRSLVLEESGGLASAVVNAREQVVSLTPPSAAGARAFDDGDILRDLLRGRLPADLAITNGNDLISGAFAYDLDLAPGASRSILVAAPLHRTRAHLDGVREQAAGEGLDAAFDRLRAQVRADWRAAAERVVFELPDPAVEHTVKSQLAYILANMDGLAIQPGSRNYKRTWMRDGGVTSIALLRMGITEPVRAYLAWYAARVQPDGMVPPILNNDGSVYDGYGSNLEYDSQGQFVHAVLEYCRLTGDRAFLEAQFPAIERALRFLVQLRERTLAPDYLADEPARDRFAGILPPSYSHEGYNPPMHSYWDVFWALKGWKDGRVAAELMERPDLAAWCGEQYALLRDSTRRTIEATMAFKGIDFIPGCADKGDFDATSTAIALAPCGERDTLPDAALQRTFDRYVADVRARLRPDAEWVYTPYEARNISALVELGRREDAAMLLDFLLSCRRPAAWNHLAEVVVSEYRKGTYIGDMPHTWVGSDLVNAVRQMIVQEEERRLDLLKGVPPRWLADGNGLRIGSWPTHFGPLTMAARLSGDTLTVHCDGGASAPEGRYLHWPRAGAPARVVVDGEPWTDFDDQGCRLPGSSREIVATWP